MTLCKDHFSCNCNYNNFIVVNRNAWFSCLWCKQIWKTKTDYLIKHLTSKETNHIKNYYWDELGKILVSK
jgi:hypothetical protein